MDSLALIFFWSYGELRAGSTSRIFFLPTQEFPRALRMAPDDLGKATSTYNIFDARRLRPMKAQQSRIAASWGKTIEAHYAHHTLK
jgi:hypothetical protein